MHYYAIRQRYSRTRHMHALSSLLKDPLARTHAFCSSPSFLTYSAAAVSDTK